MGTNSVAFSLTSCVLLTLIHTPAQALPQANPPAQPPRVEIDPIIDVALLGGSLAFASVLEMVIRTGELRPQEPIDADQLLGIDRWRAQSQSTLGVRLSDITIGLMFGAVIADIVTVDALDRGNSWLDYLVIYGETSALALALTNLAKVAVRRPRPVAYFGRENGEPNTATDTSLSFFSGHTALAGAVASTAAYLAWVRGDKVEAWLVSTLGFALTSLVGVSRVLEGKHFPTDVIAGGVVGIAVGLIVPHLHLVTGVRLTGSVQNGGGTIGIASSF